ncbi:MAG: hypothetical protein RJA52_1235, partial [Bacteroidota bacterium]
MSESRIFGLVGYPLSHSFSKGYFAKKFIKEGIDKVEYQNFPIQSIEDFLPLIDTNPHIKGLNVTIPYKEKIIPYLNELDPVADQIQAVNTIKFNNGKLIGYNTDVIGFEKSLLDFIQNKKIPRALILGTGGASKAVKFVLDKLKIPIDFVTSQLNSEYLEYHQLMENLSNYPLIINTTPLGMSPNINECPDIPYEELSTDFYLYDLIYNPPL